MKVSLNNRLKKSLSFRQIEVMRRIRYLYRALFISWLYTRDLNRLARLYGADKYGLHWYTQHYQRHFHSLRKKKLNILEIGAGGYADSKAGAYSLRMWKRYFPKSRIYSIDVYDKSALEERRIKIFRGSQADEKFLRDICSQIGSPLDIVIDDGSHKNSDVIGTFKILFPLLKNNGIYAVEDTQTSYWPQGFGGDSLNLDNPDTTMNFFKKLTDSLNYEEFLRPDYKPSYFDRHVISVHFYHNLVFIYKGFNKEGSIFVKEGEWLK
jgi:hypothetical protein